MLICSFCGSNTNDVSAMLAGPEVNICDKCIAVGVRTIETRDALEESLPLPEELSSSDDELLLSQMAATSAAVDKSRSHLQLQIVELRNRGLSWGVIGAALGVSHQIAQERFG
ncbi:MAG: ClpX C4-type zinc finger protein [Pseudomonadota bacterium]